MAFMVDKKQPKPKATTGRLGRPAKSTGGVADFIVGLRLSPPDRALLEAIQAEEQKRVTELGLPMQVSPADALRIMLRSEGKRRGLTAAA
jgi:hypothetical protein